MKKTLLLLILVVTLSTTSYAQKLISFGPRVGMNYNFATGETSLNGELGWNVGAFIEVRPIKFLSVSLDVMYSKEGFSQNMADNSTAYYKLGYLDIPILVNFYVWKGLNVKAGIQPSIALTKNLTREGGIGGYGDDLADDIKTGKFAVPIGIGYQFGFGLSIDLRYNLGLSRVSDKELFKSQIVNISAAWKF